MRMMKCYGYEFPIPYPQWEHWQAVTSLDGKTDREVILQMDFSKAEADGIYKIHLSVYADNTWPDYDWVPFWKEQETEWISVDDE